MIPPDKYLIDELKKNPEEYQSIIDQSIADDEDIDDDTLYLFLASYEGKNTIVLKWKDKWDFLISYLYLNR